LMGLGGFVSIAHTPQDVARTVDALDAALVQVAPLLPTAQQTPSATTTSPAGARRSTAAHRRGERAGPR
jgi:hypothetical protein